MKKDEIVITFSNMSNTKSYNLNTFIQKFIIYVASFIIVILVSVFFFLSYLNNKVDDLTKQNKLQKLKIIEKRKELAKLDDTLEDLKTIVGIKTDDIEHLIEEATLKKLSISQKHLMLAVIPSGKPMQYEIISSAFGFRIHPKSKTRKFHKGIDLKAPSNTPIYATADGVIKYVQNKNIGGYGRRIIILHNYGFETAFGHLRRASVKVGDFVKKGDLIGFSGNSGRSTGPHLHYEILHAKRVLNPYNFIVWNIDNYENLFRKERKVKWDSLIGILDRQNKMANIITSQTNTLQ
ncbi:MAG: M23 family peptidase [Epsilonproteobacteria bacterium]|nr:MAG: M23 family peptidase [Campylobacterota bacterium]